MCEFYVITVCKWSFGARNVFLHLSVILFTQGFLPHWMRGYKQPLGRHPPGRNPLGRHPLFSKPPGQTPHGRHPSRADTSRQTPRLGYYGIRSTSRRYGMHTCFKLLCYMNTTFWKCKFPTLTERWVCPLIPFVADLLQSLLPGQRGVHWLV